MPKSFREPTHSNAARVDLPDPPAAPAADHQLESLESRVLLAAFSGTNTNRGGAGSLRDAITRSNTPPGVDTIEFDVASSSKVTGPASPLPDVNAPAVIDATTQAGYAAK